MTRDPLGVFTLVMHPSALRDFYGVGRGAAAEIGASIETLRTTPYPPQSRNVAGRPGRFEWPIQGYVVTYTVEEERRRITIQAITLDA